MAEQQKEKGHEQEHEYELIPVSPLRRLEKRIDQIEKQAEHFDSREFYKELVEIIRMNQQLVDELAKANDALRIELSRLPARLEDLTSKVEELVSFIKASGGEEVGVPSFDNMKPIIDKLNELVETNKKIAETNQSVMSALEEMEKKMRRPIPPPIRRPVLFPPKPI